MSKNASTEPWNDDASDWEPVFTCTVCGREFDSPDDEEACTHTCKEEEDA
jgi:hypothetical protein